MIKFVNCKFSFDLILAENENKFKQLFVTYFITYIHAAKNASRRIKSVLLLTKMYTVIELCILFNFQTQCFKITSVILNMSLNTDI